MNSRDLLVWYEARRRDLPWRKTRDSYLIWVSEVMLQQTQVATVIPYYETFVARFPTVEALAAAAVDEVLTYWSGLGYYRRARQLHQAARQVVERGGAMPASSRELEGLPGIGSYTAAAIASIAFDEVVPVLDGNVERVLARLGAIAEDTKKAGVRRQLIATARQLLDRKRPGDSNQALMELGATVCRPQRPDCPACPLRRSCQGAKGDPELYPRPRPRREVERHHLTVALVVRGGKVLCFRRPQDSVLLAGLWELPNVVRGETLETSASRLGTLYGGTFELGAELGQVRHTVTYRSLEMHVHRAVFRAGTTVAEGPPEAAWISAETRGQYAFSSSVGKILEKFAAAELSPGRRARNPSRRRR
ncbi:MAG: A/G-specific adenine glycosylase [Thermoanaerobaculia bacterium]|nr:A/G-specific adenine glycosylase [Thermoanaerobaculia bacterium]